MCSRLRYHYRIYARSKIRYRFNCTAVLPFVFYRLSSVHHQCYTTIVVSIALHMFYSVAHRELRINYPCLHKSAVATSVCVCRHRKGDRCNAGRQCRQYGRAAVNSCNRTVTAAPGACRIGHYLQCHCNSHTERSRIDYDPHNR